MKKIANTLNALGDTTRLRIVETLIQEDCCIGLLSKRLKVEPKTLMDHLEILYESKIVYVIENGNHAHIFVNRNTLQEICFDLEVFVNQSKHINGDNYHC